MDIALDTNILIADPWLNSQFTRKLLDHVKKSRDRILLSEVVRIEAEAHFKRRFAEHTKRIESACKRASRNGVTGLPDFSPDEVLQQTVSKWKARYRHVLNEEVVTRVSIPDALLPEVVRRAAERESPCSSSGNGIRDAVIWLSLLEFCHSQSHKKEFAFISANTKDFADSDGTSLGKTLARDAERYGIEVSYYPSVKCFLTQYAEPVSHIDFQWLRTRVDLQSARKMILEYLSTWGLTEKYNICESRYRERFRPTAKPKLSALDAELGGFQLWKFGDEHIEATLSFIVSAEGEAVCDRELQGRLFYKHEDDEPTVHTRMLKVSTQLGIDISACIVEETVELLQVEDACKR